MFFEGEDDVARNLPFGPDDNPLSQCVGLLLERLGALAMWPDLV